MKQKVYGILVIVWMMAIFMFSAQDADESSKMSSGVGDTVGKIFVKEYESWPEERRLSFVDAVEFPLRKVAHASEYTLLGFLLMGAFQGKKGRALLTGALYAVSDEVHQLFVPGRSGQIMDVMIDSSGVILGILIFCLGRRIIGEKR